MRGDSDNGFFGLVEGAAHDLAEEERVVLATHVHVPRDGGIELARVHVGGVDHLALQLHGAFGDAHGLDYLRRDGHEPELLELVVLAPGHVGATQELAGHLVGGDVDDEAHVFGYQLVRILFLTHGKHEHVAVPHTADSAPTRVHDVDLVARTATHEHAAHLNGVHYYISLSVGHFSSLLILFNITINDI